MSRPAIFLDRDGVINSYVYNEEFGTVDSPSNPDQFVLMEGVADAIARLNRLDMPLIVISNQPGIAKRKFTSDLLSAMTYNMVTAIEAHGGHLDGIYYCLHHPDAAEPAYRMNCDCRKPKPGLLRKAAEEMNIDLPRSFMIGDGIQDIQAGAAVGSTTIFISSRKCYVCDELARQNVRPDYIVPSLADAAVLIERVVSGGTPVQTAYNCTAG